MTLTIDEKRTVKSYFTITYDQVKEFPISKADNLAITGGVKLNQLIVYFLPKSNPIATFNSRLFKNVLSSCTYGIFICNFDRLFDVEKEFNRGKFFKYIIYNGIKYNIYMENNNIHKI